MQFKIFHYLITAPEISPTHMLRCSEHNHVQTTCSSSAAIHAQDQFVSSILDVKSMPPFLPESLFTHHYQYQEIHLAAISMACIMQHNTWKSPVTEAAGPAGSGWCSSTYRGNTGAADPPAVDAGVVLPDRSCWSRCGNRCRGNTPLQALLIHQQMYR